MAVAPDGLVAELYRSAGVKVVARNIAQSKSDDVVAKIVSIARKSGADEVILLPNGLLTKRELVSIERSSHAFEQSVVILPTATLVAGLAAVSVHEPAQPWRWIPMPWQRPPVPCARPRSAPPPAPRSPRPAHAPRVIY